MFKVFQSQRRRLLFHAIGLGFCGYVINYNNISHSTKIETELCYDIAIIGNHELMDSVVMFV